MPVPFDEVNCEERPEEVRKQMRDIWGKSVAGRRYRREGRRKREGERGKEG